MFVSLTTPQEQLPIWIISVSPGKVQVVKNFEKPEENITEQQYALVGKK